MKNLHWTERSDDDFAYSVAADFMELLQDKMEKIGWKQIDLAKAAKVGKSRVSRIFKDPGNLEIKTMVKFARALRMKVAALPYEDKADPTNERGPINSEIFRLCWDKSGRPTDMWSIQSQSAATVAARPYSWVVEPRGRHGLNQPTNFNIVGDAIFSEPDETQSAVSQQLLETYRYRKLQFYSSGGESWLSLLK